MRILLAMDGSPSSIQARDLVANLHWPAGSTVRLVTVCEPPIDWTRGLGAGMAWVGDAEDALRDELGAEISRLAEPLAGHDWTVDWRVVGGRPATSIIDAADAFRADLIVVGSRGRGPLASMLLGSVSAEIVEHAPCSVLVARSDHVARLLLAADGSVAARSIPALLGRWSVFRGVPADVLSVSPVAERTFELLADVYTVGAYGFAERPDTMVRQHRDFADEAVRRLGEHGIPATSSVAEGDAAHEIVEGARRRGSDLVITGTRGLHGLERALLGSVARNVLVHAPCSVLVIRDSAVTSDSGTGVASDVGTAATAGAAAAGGRR